MSRPLQFASLLALTNALPNLPQKTPAPSIAKLEVKRAIDTGNVTLIGYYTESSSGPWQTNTCGGTATWSTSGQYGACAVKQSQSLYTACSGNVLVAAAGLTTQPCGASYSICTTLYRATDFQDVDPLTYLICDVSSGLSKRFVYAETASTTSTSLTQPTSTSATATAPPTAPTTSATAPAATTTPVSHRNVSGEIAGIVVGSIVLVSLVAAASLLWTRRRNKKENGFGEMEDTSRRPPVELAAEEKLKELPAHEIASELPASPNLEYIKRQQRWGINN